MVLTDIADDNGENQPDLDELERACDLTVIVNHTNYFFLNIIIQ